MPQQKPAVKRQVYSVRLLPAEVELIKQAAKLDDRNVGGFMRFAALERAKAILSDIKSNTKSAA